MPRKNGSRSLAPALTTSPTKKTPKPRGRPAKIQWKNQPAGSSIDALELTIVEPPEKVPEEPVECSYPFDNPSEIVERDINGTIQAVRKAVTGVLDEHNVRCSIPVDEMSMISKRIKKKLVDRKLDRVKGNSDDLKETLNEAFDQLDMENDDFDESFLRQELIKYILISSCQFDKLSLGTVLSMVQDLNDSAMNTVEYESGYPERIPSSVSKFHDLTDKEFQSQNESIQLKMKKDYVKEGIRYCEKVKQFLDEKHKRMKERRNDDSINPCVDWPEGQEKEDQLMESFKKNQDRAGLLKMEYEDLEGKVADVGRYRTDFRAMCRERNGVMTKEEEEQIDKDLKLSQFGVIKSAVDNWKKRNQDGMNENAIGIEMKMGPSIKTKMSKPLEYGHSFISTQYPSHP